MSKTRCQELIATGDRLFGARSQLMSLWQDIADNFYPERATFTASRTTGEDFAAHLATGFPLRIRRELANTLSAMLRPRQKMWANVRAVDDAINNDPQSKRWLERASKIMFNVMYERHANFVRATKAGDHDFATFGNAVLDVRLRRNLDGMLYRCHHLAQAAWSENADDAIDELHRKDKQTAKTLVGMFPKTVSETLKTSADKEPHRKVNIRHIVLPADQYDLARNRNKERFPFVSIYIDLDHDTILEELPRRRLGYVIPRWDLGAFGIYAASPAIMIALPDARLLQAMTISLLEATEKAATPPMIATADVVRSDLNLYAGGTTWVDKEYDEKLGEALRPIATDRGGLQYAFNMLEKVQQQLVEAAYLNKINLPEGLGKDMTAYETQKRVEEYVRQALPLFEPMEVEYNGGVCEETFNILLENGAFGRPEDMPQKLRGASVQFKFESPLQQTSERVKAEAFMETANLTKIAMELDPGAKNEINIRKAYRDALDGTQAPADWKRDPEEAAQLDQAQAQQLAAQQQLAAAGAIADVADRGGSAIQRLADANGMLRPDAAAAQR